MRVGIYARVSTFDQDINIQLYELNEYAKLRKFEVYDEYTDEGISGSKGSRPALNRLLDDCKKRKIDAILVWKLDRFGRNLKHLITTLDELNHVGVSFISFTENIDFTTPMGKLMFSMLGAFAEYDRDINSEKVKAGLENARRKGKTLGRPAIKIDIDRAKELYKTMSLRKVADELNVSLGLVHKTINQ